MMQHVFDAGLANFCRDFLLSNDGKPARSGEDFLRQLREQEATLFQHLLLFDRVALKIHGENVPAALLYGRLGERGLEALLEQRALEFILWTPMVVFMEDNISGLDAIGIGELNSPPHSDPEKSAETGLNWLPEKLPRNKRRRLVRKLAAAYRKPQKVLAQQSWDAVRGALRAGHLRHFGFPEALEGAERLDNLQREQKVTLAKCTETVLEYEFLMRAGLTSFSSYDYYSPFWASAQRFKALTASVGGFAELAKIEGVPDLKNLYGQIPDALQRLPDLRSSANAKLFREWLAKTSGESPDGSLVRHYVDALANRKGFFDGLGAKFGRTVAMATAGMGLGAAVAGAPGAAAGGALIPLLTELAASTSLGLVDSVLALPG